MANVRGLPAMVAMVAVLVFAAGGAAFAATSGAPAFDQPFDSAPLDTSAWSPNLWGLHTNPPELQYYDSSALSFTGGGLRITTSNQPMGGMAYTSGIVTTRERPAFSYGYFEMRAKLPKGKGIWPAFWLTNDPSTHEIDAFELLGDNPRTVYMTYHRNHSEVYQATYTGPDFSAGYHTFGVDWQPGYIRWYIDGVLRGEYRGTVLPDGLWMAVNTAVGGEWPGSPDASTVFPQYYDVDYVRVYRTMADAIGNRAPTASADSYTTPRNTTLTVPAPGVLANDTDADGDALTCTLVSPPAHGSATLRADGALTYAPERGWRGTDGLTYAVSDGEATAQANVSITVRTPVRRLAGADRYETAARISSDSFPSARSVVLATGSGFADALAASSLAGAMNAPLLLVPPNGLPSCVSNEIQRLGAQEAVVVGGAPSVSPGVEQALRARGLRVERLAGRNRYATAATLARRTLQLTGATRAEAAFVTRGDAFPDALSISSTAYRKRFPVLLVQPRSAPAETIGLLRDARPQETIVVGGPSSVSSGVERQAGAAAGGGTFRIAGSDRYATSAIISRYSIARGWTTAGSVGVAAGTMFPDALSGGPGCGTHGGLLLLTSPGGLPGATASLLRDNASAVTTASVFGGTRSVQAGVESQISEAIR